MKKRVKGLTITKKLRQAFSPKKTSLQLAGEAVRNAGASAFKSACTAVTGKKLSRTNKIVTNLKKRASAVTSNILHSKEAASCHAAATTTAKKLTNATLAVAQSANTALSDAMPDSKQMHRASLLCQKTVTVTKDTVKTANNIGRSLVRKTQKACEISSSNFLISKQTPKRRTLTSLNWRGKSTKTVVRELQVLNWIGSSKLDGNIKQIPKKSQQMSLSVTTPVNAMLATDAAQNIDAWMRATLATGKATVYDKAMDAQHIAENMHGGYHRLFDGGHDLVSAFKSVRSALPDDSVGNEIKGALSALWKDVVTPMGLPVATIDKQQFEAVSQILEQYAGASRQWVADAASFTATEVVGTSVAGVAVALNWNNGDTQRFAMMLASTGITSIVGANPVLTVPVIVGMARLYQKAGHGDISKIAEGAGKGVTGTLAFIAVTEAIAAEPWLEVTAGLMAAIASSKSYEAIMGRVKNSNSLSLRSANISDPLPQ